MYNSKHDAFFFCLLYFTQEKDTMLEDQGIKAYVKYNYFDKDAKTGIPSISLSKTEVQNIELKLTNF